MSHLTSDALIQVDPKMHYIFKENSSLLSQCCLHNIYLLGFLFKSYFPMDIIVGSNQCAGCCSQALPCPGLTYLILSTVVEKME